MKIQELINIFEVTSSYVPDTAKRRVILSLCHDSRRATPTCAFFCKKGALSDGHEYAFHAYANGARIFVAEREIDLPDDAAVIITPNSSAALNKTAVIFYGDPAKELKIIGITGTKGKTTIAISAYKIALANGIPAGYIGTNGIYYNGKEFETANTTPDTLELQKALREMRNDGVNVVLLEVSSQALWQERTYALEFEACVFTNLYRDHIGKFEHPDIDHYIESKHKLFTDYKTKKIIVNADSPYSEKMIDGSSCENVVRTSAKGLGDADLSANKAMKIKKGIVPGVSFELNSPNPKILKKGKPVDVFIPVPGLYSVENGLLIISICLTLGLKLESIIACLSTLSVPGRFETVPLSSKPNSLFIIDYAHNGASLEAVIRAVREYEPKRIICLLGSVGGRTFERRAELGEVAERCADVIIITSDNPNNEDPASVIADIREAVGETDKPVYTIKDREEAVLKAYEIAEDGDFILLAGKGHETYQLVMGHRIPFSERKILERADLSKIPT